MVLYYNLSRTEAWPSLFGFVLPFPRVLCFFAWLLQYELCKVNVLYVVNYNQELQLAG